MNLGKEQQQHIRKTTPAVVVFSPLQHGCDAQCSGSQVHSSTGCECDLISANQSCWMPEPDGGPGVGQGHPLSNITHLSAPVTVCLFYWDIFPRGNNDSWDEEDNGSWQLIISVLFQGEQRTAASPCASVEKNLLKHWHMSWTHSKYSCELNIFMHWCCSEWCAPYLKDTIGTLCY